MDDNICISLPKRHFDKMCECAIKSGQSDLVHCLIEYYQQSDLDQFLLLATRGRYKTIIRYLIERGANVNYTEDDVSVLINLIDNNYDSPDLCQELINVGAEINTEIIKKKILKLIKEGRSVQIGTYLDLGLDLYPLVDPEINLLNPGLCTGVIRKLIEHGANIDYFLEENLINAAHNSRYLEYIKLVFSIKGEFPDNDQFLEKIFRKGIYKCIVFMVENGLTLRGEPVFRGISTHVDGNKYAIEILKYVIDIGLDVTPHLGIEGLDKLLELCNF